MLHTAQNDLGRLTRGDVLDAAALSALARARLFAMREVHRRASLRQAAMDHAPIDGPKSASAYLRPILGDDVEHVAALYLDRKNHVLKATRSTIGTSGASMFDVGGLLRGALLCNATGILIAHNHPSGQLDPSSEDLIATRTLKEAARSVGLRLLDHLIFTRHDVLSLPNAASCERWGHRPLRLEDRQMPFNPLQDPIRQWAERTRTWLNGFMRNSTFVQDVRVDPSGISPSGRLNPYPDVVFTVRSPEDATKYLTSVLQVNPLPEGEFGVRFVQKGASAIFGNIFQDIFSPNDGAGVAADIERQGRIDAKLAEARAASAATLREKQRAAEQARIEARGKADAARTASESLAAQSRSDARDQRIRDIGGRDAGWITAQGDAMQKRRTAWYDATTKQIAQTRTNRRARRAEQSEADFKRAEEARARVDDHLRRQIDARARARALRRTDIGQRAQDEAKERQRIRLEGENARREARITDRTDRVTDRITGREARLKARRDEALSNEQGWLELLLGGQKARGTAWQTALTEGVREALTGRAERQTLRTDASIAHRRESQRRKAKIAEAGRGWTPDAPVQAPSEPAPSPTAATPADVVAGLDLFGALDDTVDLFGALDDAVDLFGGLEAYGEDEAFDPKALVLRTIEKTREGTLPPPATWTRGLVGSALSLGEHLTGWVVQHVVTPVQAGTWDAVVLAGAAASKAEIEQALDRADPSDRAAVAKAIDRVLA